MSRFPSSLSPSSSPHSSHRPSLSSYNPILLLLLFLQSYHFSPSSSSSSDSIHEAFNIALLFHANLRNSTFPSMMTPSTSISFLLAIPPSPPLPPHLFLFFIILSIPLFISSSNSIILLLFLFLLLFLYHHSLSFLFPSPLISSFSSSSFSSNLIYEIFNAAIPNHTNLYHPTLPLNDDFLHLDPFLASSLSFPLLSFLLILFSFLSSISLLFPLLQSYPFLSLPIPSFFLLFFLFLQSYP